MNNGLNGHNGPATPKNLFPLGLVVSTPGALEALQSCPEMRSQLLTRHVTGDWSEMCQEDQGTNREAVEAGFRVFSGYDLPDGTRIWVITEADRSATTFLLPEEY